MDGEAWWAAVHGVAKSRMRLSDFTFTFHFHALEKEMATYSSVLAWRIPGMEPGGLPSMGLQRVGHNWSNLVAAAAAAAAADILESLTKLKKNTRFIDMGILLGKVHRLLKILVTKNKTKLKVAVTRTEQRGKKFWMLMSKFLNVRVQCSFLIKSIAQVL